MTSCTRGDIIFQENLDNFHNIAKELQLKRLDETENGGGEDEGNTTRRSYNPTVYSADTQKQNDRLKTTMATQNDSYTSPAYSEDPNAIY